MKPDLFYTDLELRRAFWRVGQGIPTLGFSGQLHRARVLRKQHEQSLAVRGLRTFGVLCGLAFTSSLFGFALFCLIP